MILLRVEIQHAAWELKTTYDISMKTGEEHEVRYEDSASDELIT